MFNKRDNNPPVSLKLPGCSREFSIVIIINNNLYWKQMKKFLEKNSLLRYLLFIILCELIGNIPTPLTISSIQTWYIYLNKPFFNPPNQLFGPVWTTLFLLMGISLGMMWQNTKYIKWFSIQLALNVLWSFIFFQFRSPVWAFFEILVLWSAIFMTIKSAWSVNRLASYLLIPYLLWVSFATLLTFSVWQLN